MTPPAESERTTPIVHPTGRVDAATAPSLEEELDALIAAGHQMIVVDLAETSYLSSSGLRTLLIAHRHMQDAGGTLSIRNANAKVMYVIALAGFDRILSIDDAPDATSNAIPGTQPMEHV